MATTSTMSDLLTGEPKIVWSMSRICRPKLKWAVSPSGKVPEISVERSITLPSALPRFGVRISPHLADSWGLTASESSDAVLLFPSEPADPHLPKGVGNGRHRLAHGVGADGADAAYAKCIDGRELARVQDESAPPHPA